MPDTMAVLVALAVSSAHGTHRVKAQMLRYCLIFPVVTRALTTVRNNGYAANAVQLHQDHIVGSFFRLSYRPSWRFLGIERKRPGRSPVKLRRHGKNLRRMIAAALMRNVSVHSP